MTETNGNNPFSRFMDDYFAEVDEHLGIIRSKLISLETRIQNHEAADLDSLNELLRCFHTVKGLSGMVALAPAEDLAHHTETCLRQLSLGEMPLTQEVLGALVQATGVLEGVIVARRRETAMPSIAEAVERLKNQHPVLEGSAKDQKTPSPGPKRHLSPPDQPVWRFLFSPAQDLSQKGIDVNRIRGRLEKIGALLQVTPQVNADGKVFFEFLVATSQDEKTFEPWKADGVSWAPHNAEAPPGAPGKRVTPKTETPLPDSLPSVTPSNIVRVNLERLDDLMKRVGDLVISRSRMENRIGQLEKSLSTTQYNSLQEIHTAMERQLRDLREGIMRLRLVPMGDIFTRMQFLVRDLAPRTGKKVAIETIGKNTEIDKFLVERMMDPLLHLVRNAMSHGLEPETERIQKKKDPQGTITLSASTEGDAVIIEVSDDGRGIDRETLRQRAHELGLITEKTPLTAEDDLLGLMCTPGFSTRLKADMESGRGVGMTVVSETVRELGGSMTLSSEPEKGSSFRIRLPLTLAIVDAFIVSVGAQVFAVPQPSVREVIDFRNQKPAQMENNELISYRGGALPLIRLSRLFGIGDDSGSVALVVGNGPDAVGLTVDRVMTKQEIVVRTLDDPLVMMPGIAGATELGDGRAVMILNPAELIRHAGGMGAK